MSETKKAEISDLIAQRDTAKKEKNFALADEIREKLALQNITLMDTPNGTVWEISNETDIK